MTEEINGWVHWKKDKNQLWEGKRSQKGQRKKKVRESSIGSGEVEEKAEMLQKMGDIWPRKCELPRARLQRYDGLGWMQNNASSTKQTRANKGAAGSETASPP